MTEASDPGSPSSSLPGRVVFVGAGPGSADLITLRGAERLASADVVLHDALTDPALRRFAPHARWIDVGKRGFADSTGQATINALLVKHAREVGVVVRLKGGDPSIFGRLEEELQALADAGIACEVVPGVTAALASAAASQRPLTRRGAGRSVGFATAVTAVRPENADERSRAEPRSVDTEVYYMAGKQLAALARRLADAGWPADTLALVASRAGWPDALASDHTVATLAAGSLLHAGRPTVVTVGAGAQPPCPCPSAAAAIGAAGASQRVDKPRSVGSGPARRTGGAAGLPVAEATRTRPALSATTTTGTDTPSTDGSVAEPRVRRRGPAR